MSSVFNKTARDFADALKHVGSSKTSPYDIQAEVKRIEGNTAWVHIPGGVDETPVQLTTNAKKGDVVQVRVSGGRAWLYGNVTSPPTDDTVANKAQKTAAVADEHATNAVTSAMLAQQFADTAKNAADDAQRDANIANSLLNQMEIAAEEADTTLTGIYQDARNAEESAQTAYDSASQAMYQLGVVEDIVGVLKLVADNGVYAVTQDTKVKEDKWYFTVDGTAVSAPTGDPHHQGLYERTNGIYSLTQDTTVISGKTYYTILASLITMFPYDYYLTDDTDIVGGKTYYTRSGSGTQQDPYVYTEVETPVTADIGSYYELTNSPAKHHYYQLESIDQSITNYVADHLVYANGVLSIQNGTTRVSLSTDPNSGLTFYNNGQQVAQYGASATIGDPTNYHITMTNNRLSFYSDSVTEVAYIDGDQLFIKKSVVIQQMDVGDEYGMWSWKIHRVNNANNLYLKWLG